MIMKNVPDQMEHCFQIKVPTSLRHLIFDPWSAASKIKVLEKL
jgi:hypothetical protein